MQGPDNDLDSQQHQQNPYNLPPSFFQDDADQNDGNKQDYWPSKKPQQESNTKLKAFLGNRHRS